MASILICDCSLALKLASLKHGKDKQQSDFSTAQGQCNRRNVLAFYSHAKREVMCGPLANRNVTTCHHGQLWFAGYAEDHGSTSLCWLLCGRRVVGHVGVKHHDLVVTYLSPDWLIWPWTRDTDEQACEGALIQCGCRSQAWCLRAPAHRHFCTGRDLKKRVAANREHSPISKPNLETESVHILQPQEGA